MKGSADMLHYEINVEVWDEWNELINNFTMEEDTTVTPFSIPEWIERNGYDASEFDDSDDWETIDIEVRYWRNREEREFGDYFLTSHAIITRDGLTDDDEIRRYMAEKRMLLITPSETTLEELYGRSSWRNPVIVFDDHALYIADYYDNTKRTNVFGWADYKLHGKDIEASAIRVSTSAKTFPNSGTAVLDYISESSKK